MIQKRCVARHAFDLYFLATFCDLTLTFPGMTFALMQYPQTFTSFLCEFEHFAAHLTDPSAQNAKKCVFYL